MELWVRSQDRERLTKPIDFYIEANINFYTNKPTDFDIYALNFANSDIKIGKYKTKERALEVLDEIQNLLKPRMITTNYQCEIQDNPIDRLSFNLDMKPQKIETQEFSTYVYEMPKE